MAENIFQLDPTIARVLWPQREPPSVAAQGDLWAKGMQVGVNAANARANMLSNFNQSMQLRWKAEDRIGAEMDRADIARWQRSAQEAMVQGLEPPPAPSMRTTDGLNALDTIIGAINKTHSAKKFGAFMDQSLKDAADTLDRLNRIPGRAAVEMRSEVNQSLQENQGFLTPDMQRKVTSFFAEHPLPSEDTNIRFAEEIARLNKELYRLQYTNKPEDRQRIKELQEVRKTALSRMDRSTYENRYKLLQEFMIPWKQGVMQGLITPQFYQTQLAAMARDLNIDPVEARLTDRDQDQEPTATAPSLPPMDTLAPGAPAPVAPPPSQPQLPAPDFLNIPTPELNTNLGGLTIPGFETIPFGPDPNDPFKLQ